VAGNNRSNEQDNHQDPIEFFQDIMKSSKIHGAIILETQCCTKCGHDFVVAHRWGEVITCVHCGNRQASKVPCQPVKGDVTVHHIATAISTLLGTYSNVPNAQFVTETEWKKLSPEVQALLTVNMSAAAIAVLKQVDSLAVALAKSSE
jgi:hypothetical protein